MPYAINRRQLDRAREGAAALRADRAAEAKRAKEDPVPKRGKTKFGEYIDKPPDVGYLRKSADSAIEELQEALDASSAAAQRNNQLDAARSERARNRAGGQ